MVMSQGTSAKNGKVKLHKHIVYARLPMLLDLKGS